MGLTVGQIFGNVRANIPEVLWEIVHIHIAWVR